MGCTVEEMNKTEMNAIMKKSLFHNEKHMHTRRGYEERSNVEFEKENDDRKKVF